LWNPFTPTPLSLDSSAFITDPGVFIPGRVKVVASYATFFQSMM